MLCEGNSRAIDVGNGIIFAEVCVPNNFVSVLKDIVNQARENKDFVAINDVIMELNEMSEGYKSLYIRTLSKLVSDCNLPLRDDNILLYLKNRSYELGMSLSKLSDIWEGSIDGLDSYEGLKKLKKDCPYPMYSMVQKLLICDLYRINYVFSKNTVQQDVQEKIDTLLDWYEIDGRQIDRDFVLLDLRIEDDAITNQQMKDIVNSTADAIIGLGLSFFAGILSVSHPILSVCSFLGGNFGSKKISSTFFSDGKRNQFRVEVLSGAKEQYESLKSIIDDDEEKARLAKKIQNINKLIEKYSETECDIRNN